MGRKFKMNRQIPVVFVTDNNYVLPTSVAIQSMIKNATVSYNYDIYIIAKDVSQNNKYLLQKFENSYIKINIIDINKVSINKYNEEGYYVSSTALLKFDIADLLPQYDKVLYIDGDVLILKDISTLYEINIDDYFVAAIPDMAAVDSCHFDEHLNVKNYFNSGVMLLNASLIRKNNISKQLYEVKRLNPDYKCMDQDVFNDVFYGRVLYLPPKYNLMFYNFLIAKYSLGRVNEFYNTDYSSFQEMEEDAVIIHLTNEKKPWKYKDAYKFKEWCDFYKQTPFHKHNVKINFQETESIKTKKGPFTKIWTKDVTSLSIGKILLAQKIRSENESQIIIGGLKCITQKKYGFNTFYYFLGIPYKSTYDFRYFIHRLYAYKDILRRAITQIASLQNYEIETLKVGVLGNIEDQINLFKQISLLKEMKKQYERSSEVKDEVTI